ncbi:hypothetical protein NIES4071_15660 [Calothrix sp. NIES-4071]|nr:hypothetical protein NIES4071_15660 [Calothrix sp. NIES-4071]BAZ55903.1 hypothetical protein NIES4105_15610 [Calothrix sp. NIES-4105]
MNIQELRQSLKQKWLYYYQQNRHWLEKMQIWAVFDGERRPLSSFVLATVSVLEPNLVDILPLLVDLNTNPDDMIAALGLNFNPDNELKRLDNLNKPEQKTEETSYKHPENKPELVTYITPNYSLQHQTVLGAVEHTATDTVVSTKKHTQLAVATSRNEIKSLQSVALVTQTSIRDIPISAVTTAPPIKSNYKLAPEIQNKVNQLSTVNRRKLANWIDEFCQGRDWDRDESTFIPF